MSGGAATAEHGQMDRLPHAAPRPPARRAGFTLVEMIVTLAIAAAVVAVAVPAMSSWMGEQAAAGNADELAAALRFARSEAIKRSQAVTVCASTDGQECGESWAAGWVVLSAGEVLRVQGALAGMSLVDADDTEVNFTSNGLASLGEADQFTFTLVPKDGDTARQRVVTLLRQGRVTVTKGQS